MIVLWVVLVLTVIVVAATVFRLVHDDRDSSHGLMVVGSAVMIWLLAFTCSAVLWPDSDAATIVFLVPAMAILLLLVTSALALVTNTPIVVRREGLRVATLVPAAIGGAIIVTLAIMIGWLFTWDHRILLMALLPLAMIPGALMIIELLAYTLYALVYGGTHREVDATDVIVVLGAGLSGGKPTPLVARRLDRAVEVYHHVQAAQGAPPRVVVSGGKGSDEVVSEAAAMAAYLAEHSDVPSTHVILEDTSTTTQENLTNTLAVLAAQNVVWERMVVVTSNFHVLRSASLTQRLGIRSVTVLGAPTAWYYLPSGFLREFAAGVVHYRKQNLAVGPRSRPCGC
ncbi:YdcF family protein [Gordonia sp. DT219]|uniref:YdcF family protein n=1 Tax=Gordonia sp. DT219 TaxID=3416658 RepID=UPI003CF3FF40